MSVRNLDTIRYPILLTSLLLYCGCGSSDADVPAASISAEKSEQSDKGESPPVRPVQLQASEETSESPARPKENLYPHVVIRTSLGEIKVQLNAEKAPRTVENFLHEYVDNKFYDQTLVHYVDQGFMIAAGGYTKDRKPKQTRTEIRSEANNGLKNVVGAIAMARDPEYVHSATSQFFINLADNDHLNYEKSEDGSLNGYCVFGKVVEGLDVVRKIGEVKTTTIDDFANTPAEAVVIQSIERAD